MHASTASTPSVVRARGRAATTARATAAAPVARVVASSPAIESAARVAARRSPAAHRRLALARSPRPAARRATVARRATSAELAQLALELDEETITTILAAGLGIPIFFVTQEKRDEARLEEIRELNRATLKATGEQMSEEEIADLRPSRYLDRREFKDDD